MSTVSFNYWEIDSSIKKAKKTASYLSDYISDMNSVTSSCKSLTGSDSCGYVDCAVELINKKITHARKTEGAYKQFYQALDRLGQTAEEKDKAVAKNIDVTVSNYVGRRSWGQLAGDWLYNRYVDFLDVISSLPPVGDSLAQGIRTAGNWISDTTVSAYNYFKYGDGKYLWNSAKSVAGAVVACVGVALMAITPAAPIFAAFVAVGVIAGTIYAVTKFGDMMASVEQNKKAAELAAEYRSSTKNKENWWETENDRGSITAARYYGSITGIEDWIDKTDFGGRITNDVLGGAGNVYRWVEYAAAIIFSACQITVAVGNTQYLKDTKGNFLKDASGNAIKKNGNFFQNIRTSYLESCGYKFRRYKDTGEMKLLNKDDIFKQKYDEKKAFSLKFFEGYGKKLSKSKIKVSGVELGILNASKLFKNVDGLISNVETINDWNHSETLTFKDGYDTGKAYIKTAQNVSFFDTFTSDVTKIEGVFSDFFDGDNNPFKSHSPSLSENAYQMYLGSRPGGAGGGRRF